MDSETEFHAALAALAWQVELGADEAVGEAPVNRYEAAMQAVTPVPPRPLAPVVAAAEAAPAGVDAGDGRAGGGSAGRVAGGPAGGACRL